ncbi:MAG: cytochrome C biogenesis protein [Methanobrevibacter sp.]|uniref:cytochrome c biogenesis CcdA family protein n=1 Tax=uncultured Methanobrevibacter sp. TaxID=253161 RepID=UPI0025D0E0B3|nr:cytochrome c biogenesis protein CcdA [uncultured Methanobrevibacter sp.]MBQ2613101.1 cytochrome C biogenesis protein [Methanobrevibacter sp.]
MEIFPLISFFMGVISILSPCILPILPIFLAFSLKSKSTAEIISFTLGLFLIFTIIIFLTGFFTEIVYGYIVYVRYISAILLLIIGILMLFDYSFNFITVKSRNSDGIVGSFTLGFLTSIAWAPCYSAYLMSLISLLLTSGDGLYAAFNIVLYSLGFGLTIFVLSFIISKINLESFVKKTNYIPKIFAVLIIIGAIYLLL